MVRPRQGRGDILSNVLTFVVDMLSHVENITVTSFVDVVSKFLPGFDCVFAMFWPVTMMF